MARSTISTAVGNKRLLKLAAFLRTVPRKRFDYASWVGEDWQGAQDLSCGTTGCALGWAATMSQFRRLGLRLKGNSYFGGEVVLGRSGGVNAAKRLFGLTYEEAEYLFVPNDGYNSDPLDFEYHDDLDETKATPKYVARKIEKFVEGRTKKGEK